MKMERGGPDSEWLRGDGGLKLEEGLKTKGFLSGGEGTTRRMLF